MHCSRPLDPIMGKRKDVLKSLNTDLPAEKNEIALGKLIVRLPALIEEGDLLGKRSGAN